jgi:hypothetical protein
MSSEFTETEVEDGRMSAGPRSPGRARGVPDWELLVHTPAVFVRVASKGLTGYGVRKCMKEKSLKKGKEAGKEVTGLWGDRTAGCSVRFKKHGTTESTRCQE